MKKFLKVFLVLAVLGAAGYFGYEYYNANNLKTAAANETSYTEYSITRGNLSKTVTGTGTLSISKTQDMALDYAVTVSNTLVEVGEVVSKGQALLTIDRADLQTSIETLQTELETTESSMADIMNSHSDTEYITMAQDGRFKEVYLEPGKYIEDIMDERGSIALLSLDGYMYTEVKAQNGMTVKSAVKVRVGTRKIDGVVRELTSDGSAVVDFSDAYLNEGETADVYYDNMLIGSGTAHIRMPYLMTTTARGYISHVYAKTNGFINASKRVAYLINVPISEEYSTLENTRAKQSAQLKDMRALLSAGTINAPEDGIIASVVSASKTAQEAYGTLISLYVGEEKKMIVSVDELDIINVAVGQDASIAMDAITDKTYAAEVTRISQIGTATSGVTVYDVTLTIVGDDQLKFGMNGTATIQIETVSNVLLVPISAMNSSRDGSYVWLKRDTDQSTSDEPGIKTFITTGLSDEDYAEVKTGLNDGDTIMITREAASSTSTQNNNNMNMWMNMGGGTMPSGGSAPSGGGTPSGGSAPSGGRRQ